MTLAAAHPDAEPPWPEAAEVGVRVAGLPVRIARSGLEVLNWAAILAEPDAPPPMLDATPIPKVGVTVFAGPPKVGKSLMSSQIALVRRSTYIVEEGSLAAISYRLRRQWQAVGDGGAPDLVVVHRQRIRLDDRSSVARLRDHVEVRRPDLVILDPLNRLHGADENRPASMTPVMDALAGIAYDYGTAVVAIHHTNKPSQERRGSVWDTLRGASSIRSGTDANLIMVETGVGVRIVGEFRDAEPVDQYHELDRESLTFHQTDGPKSAGKIDPDTLIAFIEETGQATVQEVADRFGVTKQTARPALEGLPGVDSYAGVRGTRFYTRGTGK